MSCATENAAALLALCLCSALGSAVAATPPEGLPPEVRARERGDGWVLTDAAGMSLYTYDRDEATPDQSQCATDCAETWPALRAAADSRPSGAWSLIVRSDGPPQWAFKGRPLYRYSNDAFVGATFGDGVETLWHLARRPISTPREIAMGNTVLGNVLIDSRRRTVYVSDRDRPGREPACTGACLQTWQPIAAPALANAFGAWSIVVRADGLRQWAYKGQPLYRRPASDIAPGEISGHGVEGWSAVILEPTPPLPTWTTLQPSDAGELIANSQGMTIYTHGVNARGRRRYLGQPTICPDGECVDAQWQVVIAAPDAKPVGSWSLIDLSDGRRQWAYKGQKLYTNALDQKPGDFKGIRFGGDRSWSAIMRDGEPMQGVSVGG